MKTIYKFIIIFLAVTITACQNDSDNDSTEFAIAANGMIQSPKWLAHVVDTIGKKYPSPETGAYAYPLVYSVKHNNQDYFYVMDGFSSCSFCGSLFFTLSGEPIEGFPGKPGESLYRELTAALTDRILLWRPGNDSPTQKP